MKSYRFRIVLIAFLLSFFAQAAYIVNWYSNMKGLNDEIENGTNVKQLKYIYSNVSTLLNQGEAIANALDNSAVVQYTSTYLNLRDEELIANKTEELNSAINELNIAKNLIEKIFLISSNNNQRNFVKEIGTEYWDDNEYPWKDELDRAQLDFVINKGNGLPVYFQKGELSQLLDKRRNRLGADSITRIEKLISELEGKVVLCRNTESTMIILVIRPDFLENYIMNTIDDKKFLTVMDQSGQIIWSCHPEEFKFSSEDIKNIYSEMSGELLSHFNKSTYISDFKTITPQGFKIIYSVPKNTFFIEYKNEILLYGFFTVIICIVSVISAYGLFQVMMRPFIKFKKAIQNQFRPGYDTVTMDKYVNPFIGGSSFRKKIFNVFIISILLPALISGVLYSGYLYFSSRVKLENNMVSISHQIGLNINNIINSCYTLNQIIPVSFLENYIKKYDEAPAKDRTMMNNFFSSQSLRPNNFSYFVLLDSRGVSTYQSIYSQNKELFNVPTNLFANFYEKQRENIFCVTGIKDIFNQQAIAIVKKINVKDKINKESKTVGYIQMILNQNIFQSIKIDNQLDFLIVDKYGQLIYKSSPLEEEVEDILRSITKKNKTSNDIDKKTTGDNKIIISEHLKELDWKVYIYSKLDSISNKSERMLLRNLLVLFLILISIFIISWLLSKQLVKPMGLIKKVMNEVGEGNFDNLVEYEGLDEIGELVQTFNGMIERINKLVEENTNQKIKEHELIMLKTQAELNMLQQQIKPHFLYNALELISTNSRQNGDDKASCMAISLSKLFRYATSTSDKLVSLKDEIEHALNYSAIQQMRFPNKFVTNVDVDGSLYDYRVLKFILQPIVENCINHGIYHYGSGGIINIEIKKEEEFIHIEVSDNGIGMKKEQLDLLMKRMEAQDIEEVHKIEDSKGKSSGIGLRNVYKRLMIYYGGNAAMIIESKLAKGTRVKIKVPVCGADDILLKGNNNIKSI